MVPTRRLPLATKMKSPCEGGLNMPRITDVSLIRETVEVISNSWLAPSNSSTLTRGWGLAAASFNVWSNWRSMAISRSRSTQGFRGAGGWSAVGGDETVCHRLSGAGRSSAQVWPKKNPSNPARRKEPNRRITDTFPRETPTVGPFIIQGDETHVIKNVDAKPPIR